MHNAVTTNLEILLQKIKVEGVEAAQVEASQILSQAKLEASDLLSRAQKEAEVLIRNAETKIADFQESSMLHMQQAARDVKRSLVESLQNRLKEVITERVQDSLDRSFLQQIIEKLVTTSDLRGKVSEIHLSPSDAEKLGRGLLTKLGQSLSKDCKLQASQGLKTGFMLQVEGEDFYLEFSDQQIAKELAKFVSPQLQSLFLEGE